MSKSVLMANGHFFFLNSIHISLLFIYLVCVLFMWVCLALALCLKSCLIGLMWTDCSAMRTPIPSTLLGCPRIGLFVFLLESLTVELRLASNLRSCCLCFLSAGAVEMTYTDCLQFCFIGLVTANW